MMPGYKHPCRYCSQLIPPDSNACSLCGKVNPLGSLRCPKCCNPIAQDDKKCSCCRLSLEIACPKCNQSTFFGDYCEHCGERLLVICPNPKCKLEQPPVGETCKKCGKPLK